MKQKSLVKKIITLIVIFVLVGMSISIYILYGLYISTSQRLDETKKDLGDAIRLLYKCQDLVDEKR